MSFSWCTLKKTVLEVWHCMFFVDKYGCFRGIICLHDQGSLLSSMIEAADSSEMSVCTRLCGITNQFAFWKFDSSMVSTCHIHWLFSLVILVNNLHCISEQIGLHHQALLVDQLRQVPCLARWRQNKSRSYVCVFYENELEGVIPFY
jgi:hypothetical protein